MVKLAVIGCGVIADYHLRAAQCCPQARIVAVADVRPEAAWAAAKRFQVPRWTTDSSEVLSDPGIDGVVLALPTQVRAALARQALQQRKHVLVEKPVAMNAAEVVELLALQNDRVAACCSSRFRALESARVAADFIRRGGLGEVRALRVRVLQPAGPPPATPPPAWRLKTELNGGGILVNWGSYDLDYMLGLFDFSLLPDAVLARTWTIPTAFASYAAPGSDAETHAVAIVTFSNGAALTYERCEYAAVPAEAAWQITGDRGTLMLVFQKSPTARLTFLEPSSEGVQACTLWSGDESGIDEVGAPLVDFVEAIEGGRSPRTSLADALVVARITDAVYESARTRRTVTLP